MAIEITKNDKGIPVKAVIKGVKVAYLKTAKPDTQLNGTEKYCVTTIIENKDDYKTLKDLCKTNFETLESDEVKQKLKIETDKALVYKTKFKANTTIMKDNDKIGLKKGDSIPYESPFRPKVYDKEGNDITLTTMVGNGSTADIEIRLANNPNFGSELNAYLSSVTITDLVEMEPLKPKVEYIKKETPSQPSSLDDFDRF